MGKGASNVPERLGASKLCTYSADVQIPSFYKTCLQSQLWRAH